MTELSRTNNTTKNIKYAFIGQMIGTIFSFANRSIFIYVLGANYLGINGLFSNILSMLSLAELGVGSAITYSLYKPIAENNIKSINAHMNLFAKAYRIIGMVVLGLGIILLPFLDYIIKDKPNIPHLSLIFMIYIINSAITYFFSYKRSLIIADQKAHINSVNIYLFSTIQNIFQIAVLIVSKNFIIYLSIQMVTNIISNIAISHKANIMYPYLKKGTKEKLTNIERNEIFKYIGAMFFHKVGAVVVFGTDNILISTFVGIYWVGLYSNYILITGILTTLIGLVFTSLTASIGNLNATETIDIKYKVFNRILFMNFWLYSFCSISLWILINPFITFWIGSQYVMDNKIVLLIIVNFFIKGMRGSTLTFRDSMGLFWNDRYKPIFESVINLVAAIILLKMFGIAGVLLGTLISTLTTSFWVEPYVVFKYGFNKKISVYFIKYGVFVIITILIGAMTQLACLVFDSYTLSSILGRVVICTIIINLTLILMFFKTEEYRHFYGLIKNILEII